jgi:ParB family chromosome partitioning protein
MTSLTGSRTAMARGADLFSSSRRQNSSRYFVPAQDEGDHGVNFFGGQGIAPACHERASAAKCDGASQFVGGFLADKWIVQGGRDACAESIRAVGLLQPIIVRRTHDGYELIAGERRWRASQKAELQEVPVIVVEAADRQSLEIALIENLQREDLNVLEEAEGYQVLADRFAMTQEQISQRVGKARASVANAMRLLALPPAVRQALADGRIQAGHAKALLALPLPDEQILLAQRIIKEHLSVRNLEKLVQKALRSPKKPRVSRVDVPASHLTYLSDKLHRHFGTSIRLASCRTYANGKKARGSIMIDFYSGDDLDRILGLLGLTES